MSKVNITHGGRTISVDPDLAAKYRAGEINFFDLDDDQARRDLHRKKAVWSVIVGFGPSSPVSSISMQVKETRNRLERQYRLGRKIYVGVDRSGAKQEIASVAYQLIAEH